MFKLTRLAYFFFLFALPSLLFPAPPVPQVSKKSHGQHKKKEITELKCYDDILTILQKIETGQWDKKLDSESLTHLEEFLADLSWKGALPEGSQKLATLCHDIDHLLSGDQEWAFASPEIEEYLFAPASDSEGIELLLCKSRSFKERVKQVKKFAKKHKREILIGAAIVVVVAVIAVLMNGNAGEAAAAGAATAAAGAMKEPTDPETQEVIAEKVLSLKEQIVADKLFPDAEPKEGHLSMGENGRVLGSILAHDTIQALSLQPSSHGEADISFSTNFMPHFIKEEKTPLIYQLRGEQALEHQCYPQAVSDFSQAIEQNPENPDLYLDRATALFEMAQYELSLGDFNHYTIINPTSSPTNEFTIGFIEGLPKGIYDSGKSGLLFLGEVATHPIQSAKLVYEGLSHLAGLISSGDWQAIGTTLIPEVYELASDWNTLSPREQGNKSVHILCKYGGDIVLPGAAIKGVAKVTKGAAKVAAAGKLMKNAQKTLTLESATAIGGIEKLSEVVQTGKKISFLASELGISSAEMRQLEQVGKIQGSMAGVVEEILLSSENRLSHRGYKQAQLSFFGGEIRVTTRNLTLAQEKTLFLSTEKLYDQNLTQLAHSFSKHAGRHPKTWGKLSGPMNSWHNQALAHLKNIYEAPGDFVKTFDSKTGLTWIEKRLDNGSGIRLNQDYTFKCFID